MMTPTVGFRRLLGSLTNRPYAGSGLTETLSDAAFRSSSIPGNLSRSSASFGIRNS